MEPGHPERRAVLLGRSAVAPVALALSTVAAVTGAVLALLPAVLRRRPAGRPAPRRAEVGAPPQTASEPIAP